MARPTEIDIHEYDRLYQGAEALVRNSTISERNKELILGYRTACLLKNVCGKVRLIRVMGALTLFGRMTDKDFDTLTRPDLEELVMRLVAREPAYSPETLGTYRAILRNFMTWVLVPHEFPTKQPPPLISWLASHIKAKDKRKLDRHELLTPHDVERLMNVATDARDKAIVSVLWESGGRIAEVGNRTVRQLQKHQFGYTLDLRGKTGQRNILLVSSAPYLTHWLAVHPYAEDPESPLWVYNQHTTKPCYIRYQTFRTLLRRLMARAGINKRIYPHLFRHSRATHCVATGLMNEAQAKQYFGWSPGSKMLANYAHLTIQDANNAILRENNLAPPPQTTPVLTVSNCPACTTINPAGAPYCARCNTVLDEAKVRAQVSDQHATNRLLLQLCKVLTDQGLLDEAATQVHNAGLGKALRDLANAASAAEKQKTAGDAP